MKDCRTSVMLTTLFLLVYTLSPYLGVPAPLITLAYAVSPLLVIWMVFSILMDKKSPDRTFADGYWYDDPSAPRSVDAQ